MNNHYNTIISDYAQAMYALRLKKVKALIDQHPDCAVEIYQQGTATEITLYSRLDPSELGMPEVDIRDLATYIASWSWPEYRYEEKRTLYRLKGRDGRDKVRVVLHLQVEQRLTGEEVALLRDLGKYQKQTSEYSTLVC